jgi:valyl-tRNA synthetase
MMNVPSALNLYLAMISPLLNGAIKDAAKTFTRTVGFVGKDYQRILHPLVPFAGKSISNNIIMF